MAWTRFLCITDDGRYWLFAAQFCCDPKRTQDQEHFHWPEARTGPPHSSNRHLFHATTIFRVGPFLSNPPPHNPRMKTENQFMQAVKIKAPDDQSALQHHQSRQPPSNELLPIHDALQVKAAEYWLKLGEADQALKELEGLPSRSWKRGWAVRTRIAAMGVLRERDEMTAQA
jgi:hypothetical protein